MADAERPEGEGEDRLARRQFLLKAAVAGTVAFAVPTIISIDPAGATGLTSPPPVNPPTVDPEDTNPPVGPTNVGDELVGQDPTAVGGAQLPRTGVGTTDLIKAGLAATAGGAALVFWTADGHKAVPAIQPVEPTTPTPTPDPNLPDAG